MTTSGTEHEIKTNRSILRRIETEVTEAEIDAVLEKASIAPSSIPADPCFRYLVYRYVLQWPSMNEVPGTFRIDKEADEAASLLDAAALQEALRILAIPLFSEEIKSVRVLVPVLRHADGELASGCMDLREHWLDYERFGMEGIHAVKALEEAMLLNDSSLALGFAHSLGRVRAYAAKRGTSTDALLKERLEKAKKDPLTEEAGELSVLATEIYYDELLTMLRTGEERSVSDWLFGMKLSPARSAIARSLVLRKRVGTKTTPFLLKDETKGVTADNGEIVLKENEKVTVAHPAEWKAGEAEAFMRIASNDGIRLMREQMNETLLYLCAYHKEDPVGIFAGIVIPEAALKDVVMGIPAFSCTLRQDETLVLTFLGKPFLEAKPEAEGEDHGGRYMLSPIKRTGMGLRERFVASSALVDAFCYELIAAGKIDAHPFAKRFHEEALQELVEASVAAGHTENTAILLHQKKELSKTQT